MVPFSHVLLLPAHVLRNVRVWEKSHPLAGSPVPLCACVGKIPDRGAHLPRWVRAPNFPHVLTDRLTPRAWLAGWLAGTLFSGTSLPACGTV